MLCFVRFFSALGALAASAPGAEKN